MVPKPSCTNRATGFGSFRSPNATTGWSKPMNLPQWFVTPTRGKNRPLSASWTFARMRWSKGTGDRAACLRGFWSTLGPNASSFNPYQKPAPIWVAGFCRLILSHPPQPDHPGSVFGDRKLRTDMFIKSEMSSSITCCVPHWYERLLLADPLRWKTWPQNPNLVYCRPSNQPMNNFRITWVG